jgi:effector-binding domain-containing protein
MKFLKILLILLLIIVATVAVLGLVMPKEYDVERSATFEKCPGMVYDQFSNFENWNNWSPWSEKDTSIKASYEGQPGTVGHKYLWEGNPDISGTGSMEITEISDTAIHYDLNFIIPFESSSKGYVKFNRTDNGMEVKWGDHGDLAFPMNIVAGLFMNFDQMIGTDFEKGLANIKENLQEVKAFEPKYTQSDEVHYIGKMVGINTNDITSELYASNLGEVSLYMVNNGIESAGNPIMVVYEYDSQTEDVLMAISIPTKEPIDSLPEIFTSGTVPAGKDAYAQHFGAYDGVEEAWNKMESFSQCSGAEMRYMPYEQYVTDPMLEPDTSLWETRVVYPLAQ